MNTGVKKFLLKASLFSIPFLLMVASYFYYDPFKVLRHYDSYFESGKPQYVTLNKDFVSVENLKNHTVTHYDSYILGNSRSMFYRHSDWLPFLSERVEAESFIINRNGDRIYHFDASNESLFGVERKIIFLSQEVPPPSLSNVLIVMDASLLKMTTNSTGHLYRKHPALSGESWFAFGGEFFKTYFNMEFMTAYLDYKFSGQIKPYMTKSSLLDDKTINYDAMNNELSYAHYDSMIERNKDEYYTPERLKVFFKRDSVQKVSPHVIGDEQKKLLQNMKRIFDANHTNLRIVISPLYDQVKLNPSDYQYLVSLFGPGVVYDYSGKNAITDNLYNYYETSHYRPPIAKQILEEIYRH